MTDARGALMRGIQRVGLSKLLLVVCGLLITSRFASANTVYQLIDGAAGNQDVNHLAGYITFSMPCGTSCTAADIVDFSFSVSGAFNYGYSYASPADVTVLEGLSHLNVTPTSIYLDSSVSGDLALGGAGGGPQFVRWTGTPNNFYYSVRSDNAFAWFHNSRSATIAVATPEPAGIAYLWTMITALVGWRSRRAG